MTTTVGELARAWAGQPGRDNTAANRTTLVKNLGNLAGMLAGLFEHALDDMLIEHVPKITVPRCATTVVHRSDLLTAGEIAALIKHCNEKNFNSPARPWLAAMIAVAAGSGLRVSELGWLLMGNVDRLTMQLHVEKQANLNGTERVELKSSTVTCSNARAGQTSPCSSARLAVRSGCTRRSRRTRRCRGCRRR